MFNKREEIVKQLEALKKEIEDEEGREESNRDSSSSSNNQSTGEGSEIS